MLEILLVAEVLTQKPNRREWGRRRHIAIVQENLALKSYLKILSKKRWVTRAESVIIFK